MTIRVSNSLISLLNVLSLLISLPTIGVGIVLGLKSATECKRYLHSPFLVLGIFLLVMSVFGVLGACCRSNFLPWIYLFVVLVLIVGLLAFTIFKTCLKDRMVCNGGGSQGGGHRTSYFHQNLSPILSGCCKPPDSCGFTHENGTYWRKPKSPELPPAVDSSDCNRWSNDQNKLCYCCNSCKAGVPENERNEWKKLSILNVLLLVLLLVIYVVGCCALRNNRTGRYQRYRGHR